MDILFILQKTIEGITIIIIGFAIIITPIKIYQKNDNNRDDYPILIPVFGVFITVLGLIYMTCYTIHGIKDIVPQIWYYETLVATIATLISSAIYFALLLMSAEICSKIDMHRLGKKLQKTNSVITD